MVTHSRALLYRQLITLLVLTLCTMTGCSSQQARVTLLSPVQPSPQQETVYISPFASILVPEEFREPAFNQFVDQLNAGRGQTDIKRFLILKDELKDIDPAWLARQTYITGEIWSYIENSGCCQTELRIKSRIALFAPGSTTPVAEISLPLESFFDHDNSSLEAERQKLATRMADELAAQVLILLRRK